MNKVLITGIASLTFLMAAQDPQKVISAGSNSGEVRYCAMLKDGKMVLLKDNAPVAADIELKDGSLVSQDGSIRRKDGTRISLSNGECVDVNGNVLPRKVQSEKKAIQKDELPEK